MLEYQNIKIFLQKLFFQELLVIKKVKNTMQWTFVGTFYEKELQKTSQKEFRIEKVIKKNVINYMLNRQDTIIRLIVGLIKKV